MHGTRACCTHAAYVAAHTQSALSRACYQTHLLGHLSGARGLLKLISLPAQAPSRGSAVCNTSH